MIADQLNQTGYAIYTGAYTRWELDAILSCIKTVHGEKELFGMRQFLQQTSGLQPLLFNTPLRNLLKEIAPGHFIVKSVYFDKPPGANWFVNWHQDKIIFVKQKIESYGFRNWTERDDEWGVQPTAEFLGDMITLRIHLDDADETNGALRVIPHSHSMESLRPAAISFSENEGNIVSVKAGDVMLMKPLLLHRSSRATSDKPRRVIHIEMCGLELPDGLEWAVKIMI